MNRPKLLRLGEVADFQSGGTPDRKRDDFYTGTTPWITGADIRSDGSITPRRKISEQAVKQSATGMAMPGDLLLVTRTSVGKATVSSESVCFSQDITGIRVIPDIVDVRYLLHFIRSREGYFANRARGATIRGVTRQVVEDLQVPVFDLAEQRRIAAVLDQVEALRAKRREAVTSLGEMDQSIFLDMFGDPVVNPRKLPVIKLAEMGTLDRGVSKHRPRNEPSLLGGQYPLIQTGDVASSGGYITEYGSTYSDLGLAQSRMWPAGTLCITIAANIAKTGILQFDACFPDSVVGFSADLPTAEYVQTWLSFLQKKLEMLAPESAQKNINLAVLRGLDIPNPGKDSVKEFATRIRMVNGLKEKHRSHLYHLDALFDSVQHRAFRGELWVDASVA